MELNAKAETEHVGVTYLTYAAKTLCVGEDEGAAGDEDFDEEQVGDY